MGGCLRHAVAVVNCAICNPQVAEKPADLINSPSHYTNGPWDEVIDVINSAVKDPDSGLHSNAIKYLLRANHKGTFEQDLKKAQWYLNRLVDGDVKKQREPEWADASKEEVCLDIHPIASDLKCFLRNGHDGDCAVWDIVHGKKVVSWWRVYDTES